MFVNKKPDVNIELSTKIMHNERKNKSINESKFQIQKLSQKQDIEEKIFRSEDLSNDNKNKSIDDGLYENSDK